MRRPRHEDEPRLSRRRRVATAEGAALVEDGLHVARERRLLDEHVREAEGRIFRSLEVDAGREQGRKDRRGTRQLHARHRPAPVTATKARTVATLPGA